MEPKTAIRLAVGFVFIAFAPYTGTSRQDKPPSSSPQIASPESADRFIGVWKLNVDKSSYTGMVREQITIEFSGGDVKFTYESLNENGVELNYSFLTDMKGGVVKQTQMDGRPMNSRSRITRLDSHRFREDSPIEVDESKVSSDGRSMEVKRTYILEPLPPHVPKRVRLVYDRRK